MLSLICRCPPNHYVFESQWAESILVWFLCLSHVPQSLCKSFTGQPPGLALMASMLQLIPSKPRSSLSLPHCSPRTYVSSSKLNYFLADARNAKGKKTSNKKVRPVHIGLPLCLCYKANLRFRLEAFKKSTLLPLHFSSWKSSFPFHPAVVLLPPSLSTFFDMTQERALPGLSVVSLSGASQIRPVRCSESITTSSTALLSPCWVSDLNN